MKFKLFSLFVFLMLVVGHNSPLIAKDTNNELPKFLSISSYSVGTLGGIMATAFSDTIEKKTGIRARPMPGATDVARILPMKTGKAPISVVSSASVYLASEGLEKFSKKNWGPQKLRQVFYGNNTTHGLAVRADSGIKSWRDLKGKRIAMPPGLFAITIPALLAYGDLTLKDVVIVKASGYTAGIKMVMEGKADACHACPPSTIMKEWESSPYGLRWLPMNLDDTNAIQRVQKIAPFMDLTWTETGALGEGGPKCMIYYCYILSSYDHANVNLIYTIVKALDEGHDIFKDVKKPYSEQWTLANTLKYSKPVYVPYHPGLIKYAKEKGLWTDELQKWQENALKSEEKRLKSWKN